MRISVRVLTLVYPTYTYANLDKVYIAERWVTWQIPTPSFELIDISFSRTLNNIAQFDGTIFKVKAPGADCQKPALVKAHYFLAQNCATAAISVSVAVDILLSALMTRLFLSERGLSVQYVLSLQKCCKLKQS